MKYLPILILILLLSFTSQAQYSLYKQGTVVDSNSTPAAMQMVFIESQHPNFFYIDTLTTDSLGLYSVSIQQIPFPNVSFKATVSDPCFGNISKYFSDTEALTEFKFCNNCNAFFTYTIDTSNPLTVHFQNLSLGNNPPFLWKFGDGTIDTSYHTTHTYTTGGPITCQLITSCGDSTAVNINLQTTIPCNSNFTYSQDSINKNLYHFTSNSTGSSLQHFWYVNNQFASSNMAFSYTFQNPSTNIITLRVQDSSGTCMDSSFIQIYNVNCTLQSSFSSSQDSINKDLYHFTSNSTGNNLLYFWYVNNQLESNNTTFSHTFQNPSTNFIKLRIQDSSGTCSDSSSILIYHTNCTTQFTYLINGYTIDLTANSIPLGTTYYWDFGDGNTDNSNSNTIQHNYTSPGNYTINLTSFRMLGPDSCIAYATQNITIANPSGNGNLYGYVFAGVDKLEKGKVTLFKFDTLQNTLLEIDTASISNNPAGLFIFQNIPYGTYKIYAEIDHTSIFDSTHFNGWSSETAFWQLSDNIEISNDSVSAQALITLPHNQVQVNQGQGVIEGQLIMGASSPISSLEGIPIYLLTTDSLIIQAKYSLSNGYYKFDQLPYGSYLVLPEYPGIFSHPHALELTPNHFEYLSINWKLDSISIQTKIKTSNPQFEEVKIYPNPAADLLTIEGVNPSTSSIQIRIMDISGRYLSLYEEVNDMNFKKILDLSGLHKGLYFIELKSNDAFTIKKIIKL